MRIFALETNKEKLLQSLLAPNEKVLRRASFHGMRYLVRILRFIVFTAAAAALWYGSIVLLLPDFTPWVIFGFWFAFVLLPFINVLIDWWHDAVVVTDEEVIIIDQTSIFRRSIRQMSLENIASVSDHTQWGNIFSFGKLQFDLKEGTGQHFVLSFVPDASEIASTISDAVVAFHRREIEHQGRLHARVPGPVVPNP